MLIGLDISSTKFRQNAEQFSWNISKQVQEFTQRKKICCRTLQYLGTRHIAANINFWSQADSNEIKDCQYHNLKKPSSQNQYTTEKHYTSLRTCREVKAKIWHNIRQQQVQKQNAGFLITIPVVFSVKKNWSRSMHRIRDQIKLSPVHQYPWDEHHQFPQQTPRLDYTAFGGSTGRMTPKLIFPAKDLTSTCI